MAKDGSIVKTQMRLIWCIGISMRDAEKIGQ